MKVQELRIGNYFIDSDGDIAVLTGFKPLEHLTRCDTKEGCNLLFDSPNNGTGYICESKKARPVEITDKWLKEFDFYYSEDFGGRGYMIDNFLLLKISEGWDSANVDTYFELEWCPNNMPFSERSHVKSKIRYVHEIQNLFYMLSGEELSCRQLTFA